MCIDNFAEQATGCFQHGKLGQLYDCQGQQLTDEQAQDLFLDEQPIEVPNAGAGSYRAILKRLGFTAVELSESTSSAGDWTFVAFDGETWYPVWQSNRYPRHGFSYVLGRMMGCESKDQLYEVLFSG